MKNQKYYLKSAAAGICTIVLASAWLIASSAVNVQAKTTVWSIGNDADEQKESASEWQGSTTYEDEVREAFGYLEKFDVVFHEKEGAYYYDDRKIRWLIDERQEAGMEDVQKCCYNAAGIIDVYTVRDEEGRLEGVRVASAEEFKEKTKKMESAVLIEEEAGSGTAYEADGEIVYGDAVYELAQEAVPDYEEQTQETTAFAESGGESIAGNELFLALGLTPDDDGHLSYKGKEVAAIYVDGVSLATWDDVSKENGVCLYVTKKESAGEITWTISEVTADELFRNYNGF